jgi:hypothetical protein
MPRGKGATTRTTPFMSKTQPILHISCLKSIIDVHPVLARYAIFEHRKSHTKDEYADQEADSRSQRTQTDELHDG